MTRPVERLDVTPILKAKKRKTPKKKSLAKQADILWGKLIRAPGRCCICGSTQRIQAAHGISRGYHATRLDPRNGFPLCASCHVYYTHRGLEWTAWLKEQWGEDLYSELHDRALSYARVDLKVTVESLKVRVAMMEAGK